MKSGQTIKLGSHVYEPAVVITGASEGIGRAAELLIGKASLEG
jgi:NADP-dependent 3-hydroxy acid dehydrogenase YdfG